MQGGTGRGGVGKKSIEIDKYCVDEKMNIKFIKQSVDIGRVGKDVGTECTVVGRSGHGKSRTEAQDRGSCNGSGGTHDRTAVERLDRAAVCVDRGIECGDEVVELCLCDL